MKSKFQKFSKQVRTKQTPLQISEIIPDSKPSCCNKWRKWQNDLYQISLMLLNLKLDLTQVAQLSELFDIQINNRHREGHSSLFISPVILTSLLMLSVRYFYTWFLQSVSLPRSFLSYFTSYSLLWVIYSIWISYSLFCLPICSMFCS